MNNNLRKKFLIGCTLFSGLFFSITFYSYIPHKQYSITKLHSVPYAFKKLTIPENTTNELNNSISITDKNKNLGFNLQKTNFKLYLNKRQKIYTLSYKFNNFSKPLMTVYEKPKYRYGLFDDKKSFWIVITDTINQNKYNIFAFYSIYKPKPIKLYESDINENLDNINIKYSNNIIRIIAPSGLSEISKFGCVSSKPLR